jgi:hypothetical protein
MTIQEIIEKLEFHGHRIQFVMDGEETILFGFPQYKQEKIANSPVHSKYSIHGRGNKWIATLPTLTRQPILLASSDDLLDLADTLISIFKQSGESNSNKFNIDDAKRFLEDHSFAISKFDSEYPEIECVDKNKNHRFSISRFANAWIGIELRSEKPSSVLGLNADLQQILFSIITNSMLD